MASSAFSSLTRWHPHGIIHRKPRRNAYLLRLAAIAAGRFFWIFSFFVECMRFSETWSEKTHSRGVKSDFCNDQ